MQWLTRLSHVFRCRCSELKLPLNNDKACSRDCVLALIHKRRGHIVTQGVPTNLSQRLRIIRVATNSMSVMEQIAHFLAFFLFAILINQLCKACSVRCRKGGATSRRHLICAPQVSRVPFSLRRAPGALMLELGIPLKRML